MLSIPNDAERGRFIQPKLIAINLHRSDRSFSERDRTVLSLLRPHLIQASQNAIALTRSQQKLQALQQTIEQLGLIGLSQTGQVRWLSDRAWSLLQHYGLTSTHQKGQVSETLERWIKHQIEMSTQMSDVPQSLVPLHIEQCDRRLIIRFMNKSTVAPSNLLLLDEPYLLFVEEEVLLPFSTQSLEALGLTRRESEVLYWLIQDKQNPEIAAELGIQLGTLKKHLEHIYTKLGVQTRTGAIICTLERLGLLR